MKSKKIPEWDWNEFFKRKEETLTREEWQEAGWRAASWPTCACGQLCKGIPRCCGVPRDHLLRKRGGDFHMYISIQSFAKAKCCFQLIERRTAELLNQIKRKKNDKIKNKAV